MMSLHKLTAGDGYTYLTRQVAAQDTTERGYSSLGDYYAGKGESPGIWTGGGIASLGIDGQVTEQQMKNLFGAGLHPDADRLEAEAISALPSSGRAVERVRAVNRAVRLGQPFLQTEVDTAWRDRLTAAYETWNTTHDNDPHDAIPASAKEQARTDLANQMFTERHGRSPADVAERTGFIAQMSRPSRTAVAGFDVTFSPVKSVSTLWAVAPPAVSRQVEDAHHAAVTSTLSWLEKEAGYTRLGAHGPAQVPVRGLVMAQFTHRDSRAGDPDLHTHVAISNKVQTLDGRWLALDARMLHRVAVAASEHYNTALEAEVTQRTGAVFADRGHQAGKRAVREIIGVDDRLTEQWSSRRQRIVTSRTELVQLFLARHGRVPTTVEMIRLAQQATLDTREGKHEPRSFAEQRATWNIEAVKILGSAADVRAMVQRVVQAQRFPFESITDELIQSLAARTVQSVAESRAHWRESNLAAEAQRQVRGAHLDPAAVLSVADQVVARCVDSGLCVPIGVENEVDAAIPEALLRADGTSIYTVAKGQLYTSVDIITAEQHVVATAGQTGARTISGHDVQIAALEWSANHDGHELNTAQAVMVTDIATRDRYLQLALAPAGTGKTTVMGVLASAWTGSGGNVLGLAPQASAAQELAAAIPGVDADTIDKLVHDITHTPKPRWPRWIHAIDAGSLVIIDEAGLASTPKLDAAISFITGRGGRVLLVGDDQQRAAIGAGGLLRDIESTHGSLTLNEVLRFTDPLEGHASLALRAGDPGAVGYLADRGRVHAVTPDTAADTVFTRWASDVAAGADSVMIAPTLSMVTALNARARQARIDQLCESGPELELPNGETVSAGDAIITKHNQRRLPMGGTDFVRNNYRWTIQSINPDGSITATEKTRGITRTLPTWYIQAGWVRLGYAHTHASVQGMTIGKAHTQPGTAHAVVTAAMTRNDLYPALTRAADGTHAYVILGGDGDTHDVTTPQAIQPATAIETLTAIIGTDGAARSVTTEQREAANPFTRLGPAVDAYVHALTVAAETTLGPDETARIVAAAEEAVPGITDQPAWETLRGHLMIIAADGQDPIAALDSAIRSRELSTARDTAAVLDFRLDPTGNHSQQPGPLPWIPQIPAALKSHPIWSTYSAARSDSIAQFADQIRGSVQAWTPHTAPTWALPYLGDRTFATQLALWRASETIADTDLRPAGPTPRRIAMIRRHRDLTNQALETGGDVRDGADRWAAVLADRGVDIIGDDYWPVLAPRLNLADTAGLHVHTLLDAATRQGPLPAESAAAALWWRLAPHIGDLAVGPTGASHHLRPPWTADLATVLGPERADRIVQDRLWPVIVSRVDTLTREGNDPTRIVTGAAHMLARNADTVTDHEASTVLLWNIGTLTDSEPLDPEALPTDPTDDDMTAPVDAHALIDYARPGADGPLVQAAADDDAEPPETSWQEGATMTLAPLDTRSDIHRPAVSRALDDDQPGLDPTVMGQPGTSTGRLKEAIAAAHEFFTASATQSWVPRYLASRGLDPLAAGYAPSGSHLVKHLRQRGFADTEMIDAGLARQSERGLYDFFRNRLTLPYHDSDGQIVGFMTRKPPTDATDRNPKYLNSPDTAIFHKKQLPLGLDHRTVAALRAGTDVVLVEGPMDALAINTATDRNGLVAIATGGTALTPQHLQTLDSIAPLTNRRVLVLMDNDLAGEAAATKAYHTLAAAGIQNVLTTDPLPFKDASQMLEDQGPQALRYALDLRRPVEDLVVDRIGHIYASHRTPQEMETVEARLNVLYSTAPIVSEMNTSQQNRQTLRLADNLHLKILTVFDEIERRRATRPIAAIGPQVTDGLTMPPRPNLSTVSPGWSGAGKSRETRPPWTRDPSSTLYIAGPASPDGQVVRQPETDI